MHEATRAGFGKPSPPCRAISIGLRGTVVGGPPDPIQGARCDCLVQGTVVDETETAARVLVFGGGPTQSSARRRTRHPPTDYGGTSAERSYWKLESCRGRSPRPGEGISGVPVRNPGAGLIVGAKPRVCPGVARVHHMELPIQWEGSSSM